MLVKTAQVRGTDTKMVIADLHAQLPDQYEALVIFASSSFDLPSLVSGVRRGVRSKILVGCSSAGEFAQHADSNRAISAMAIGGDDLFVEAGVVTGISADRAGAGRRLATAIGSPLIQEQPNKVALVLADALAGYTETLVSALLAGVGPTWRVFGGGAGDDAQFNKTYVFHDDRVYPDAAVALAIGSEKPIGLSARHEWECASKRMRVTSAEGILLKELDGAPALEAVEAYARQTRQHFDRASPVDFFLHNVLGIQTPSGYKLRVPLAIEPKGVLRCASDVPEGALLCFMRPPLSSSAAAESAAADALTQLGEHRAEGALLFDCAATRLRLGIGFADELNRFAEVLKAPYAGCNTYGQIAPSATGTGVFHNCTAVVCVFPK